MIHATYANPKVMIAYTYINIYIYICICMLTISIDTYLYKGFLNRGEEPHANQKNGDSSLFGGWSDVIVERISVIFH